MRESALSVFIIVFLLTTCKPEDTSQLTNPDNSDDRVLSILTPNGGESIVEGTSFIIRWSGNGSFKIKIRYTTDNGNSWYIVADSLTNSGSYTWNPVPNKLSNLCKIRIDAIDGSSTDQSNSLFNIIRNTTQLLIIRSPNGLERWEAGTEHTITWNSSGIDSVKIEYSTDNGNNWRFIGVDKTNAGSYLWKPVPDTPSSQVKVRIMDASDNYPVTVSESRFSILPGQKLILKSPIGGEYWTCGSERKIEWESENINNVKLQYTTNAGGDWITITETITNTGSYNWNPIPLCNSNLCKIKVVDNDDNFPFAISAGNFTISENSNKSIQVESPNGGEIYEGGSSVLIRWKSVNVQYVTVEFSTNTGANWQVIDDRTASTGLLNWNIPAQPSHNCLVRVRDADEPSVSDISDALFIIKPVQQLRLAYPQGGEVIRSGNRLIILWESVNVNKVKIEYGAVNGSEVINWIELAAGAQNSNFYEIIFMAPAGEYKIKISDADDGIPFDESNSTFVVIAKL